MNSSEKLSKYGLLLCTNVIEEEKKLWFMKKVKNIAANLKMLFHIIFNLKSSINTRFSSNHKKILEYSDITPI